VILVVAAVRRGTPPETAEAHYLLAGHTLIPEGGDVAVPNFWNAVRRQRALKAARDAIGDAGWKVTKVVSEQPCGYDDVPEDFRPYYDEAEDRGSCLVFVRDGPGRKRGGG
jgi:hypothetical protein